MLPPYETRRTKRHNRPLLVCQRVTYPRDGQIGFQLSERLGCYHLRLIVDDGISQTPTLKHEATRTVYFAVPPRWKNLRLVQRWDRRWMWITSVWQADHAPTDPPSTHA